MGNNDTSWRPLPSRSLTVLMTILISFEINIITGIAFDLLYSCSVFMLTVAVVFIILCFLKVSSSEDAIVYRVSNTKDPTINDIERIKNETYDDEFKKGYRNYLVFSLICLLLCILTYTPAKYLSFESTTNFQTNAQETISNIESDVLKLVDDLNTINSQIQIIDTRSTSVIDKITSFYENKKRYDTILYRIEHLLPKIEMLLENAKPAKAKKKATEG